MRRRATAIGALAAVALAASAAAATAPPDTAASDPKGDTRGALDLSRVSMGRAPDGRLRIGITLQSAWTGKDLLAADGDAPGSLCLKVWTTSTPPDTTPDYLVCVTADAKSVLRGTVLRERPNALPERAGTATVSRPSTQTVTLRVAQSALGRPAVLHAAAEASAVGCARPSCTDTAPDAPATLDLRLHPATG